MAQPEQIKCVLDILRAALASAIEVSRDDRLTAQQYKDLIFELNACLKVFRRHAKTPLGDDG